MPSLRPRLLLALLVSLSSCAEELSPRSSGPSLPAGSPCDETGCGAGPLLCDISIPGGFCTGYCRNHADPANEQSQCGGAGATCLSFADGAGEQNALCLPACTPSRTTGGDGGPATGCREAQLCTGWWFGHQSGQPDRAGCYPFCRTDAHCTGGQRCNPRTGDCGQGYDPSRRPDGAACNPSLTEGSPARNVQCRGTCFQTSNTDRARGVCGSLIDLAVTAQCPDSPDRIIPMGAPGRDDLGLCLFRSCRTDIDCAAPLRCATQFADPVCDWP